MICHRRRVLQRAAILQVGGDAGGPEGVVSNLGGDAGGGARKESGPKQLTQADLEGMSPEAITAALKEGRLSKLIN